MTESREVGAVRGPSARSGPCWLDRNAAWTTWRGVNVVERGQRGHKPQPTRASTHGNQSCGARSGARGAGIDHAGDWTRVLVIGSVA
jgi:hypothetical protein